MSLHMPYWKKPPICGACNAKLDTLVKAGAARRSQDYCFGCNGSINRDAAAGPPPVTCYHPLTAQTMRFHDVACAQKWFRAAIKEMTP